MAKVFTNRLKRVLPDLIYEKKSAFVSVRCITDNVVVGFEKKRSQSGKIALKLDISKAYNMVDWYYFAAKDAITELLQQVDQLDHEPCHGKVALKLDISKAYNMVDHEPWHDNIPIQGHKNFYRNF